MKYKAVIFDLDGTAIPNRRDGMPSERLVKVVKQVKDKVFLCAATGRSIPMCRDILQALALNAPCIISGGTQIVDPITEKILWEKQLPKEQTRSILDVVKNYTYSVYFGSEKAEDLSNDAIVTGKEKMICISRITPSDTEIILKELKKISNIIAHPVISWTKGCFDIHVTHSEATKKHAVEILLNMLKVKKEEVIGFGDSNNDLPIFEGVGYKIAMENGSEELKKAADLIAPHAEEDGLAEMIEQLIPIQ